MFVKNPIDEVFDEPMFVKMFVKTFAGFLSSKNVHLHPLPPPFRFRGRF